MFKQLLVIVSLSFPLIASGEFVIATSVEGAQKQAETKCVKGCLVLSPAEMESINIIISKTIKEAYEAGLRGWSKAASKKIMDTE
jgi:hypothetical protein